MATFIKHRLIIEQDGNPDIEISVKQDNTIVFAQDHEEILGGWEFRLSKEDWLEVKKFVDDRLD